MNLEVEPKVTTALTGRLGYLVETRRGKEWRAALMFGGAFPVVTCEGKPVTYVPVWLQRKAARATVTLENAYLGNV